MGLGGGYMIHPSAFEQNTIETSLQSCVSASSPGLGSLMSLESHVL